MDFQTVNLMLGKSFLLNCQIFIVTLLLALPLGLLLSFGTMSRQVEGVLNLLVQAKMLPIVVSVLIVILGVMLTLQLNKGLLVTPKMDKETWLRVLVLTAMTLVYLIAAYYAGFLITTFLYCFAMLLYLNWKQKNPVFLLVLSAVYTAVTVYLVPMMLHLNLQLLP